MGGYWMSSIILMLVFLTGTCTANADDQAERKREAEAILVKMTHPFSSAGDLRNTNAWKLIGKFRLEEKLDKRVFYLYSFDSDDTGRLSIPNSFSIFAVWQNSTDQWTVQEVTSVARTRFSRLISANNTHIDIELASKFWIHVDENGQRINEDVNTTAVYRLQLIDGKLVLSRLANGQE